MKQEDQRTVHRYSGAMDATISRRLALRSSAAGLLGLLSGSAFGRERTKESNDTEAREAIPDRLRRRMEEARANSERMRDARPEQLAQIMKERMVARHKEAVEAMKDQLGASDEEWAVIQPRLKAVYDLVHPLPAPAPGNAPTQNEVEQRSRELRELLRDQGADVNQIKTGLTALRAAKEKANQELATARKSLRQLMTIRQEATLVLNGLLD